MDPPESNASRLNFEGYINELANVIGHADRAMGKSSLTKVHRHARL